MHLVSLHAVAQRGLDLLVALNQALALELAGDDGGVPVAAIALQCAVLAGKAGGDQGLEFFCSHGVGDKRMGGYANQLRIL